MEAMLAVLGFGLGLWLLIPHKPPKQPPRRVVNGRVMLASVPTTPTRPARPLHLHARVRTPWGAFAYMLAGYTAAVCATLRDIEHGARTGWEEVWAARPPAPTAPLLLPAPPAAKPVMSRESAPAPAKPADPVVRTTAAMPSVPAAPSVSSQVVKKELSDSRRKALVRAIEAGLSANVISDLMGGTRADNLAVIAKIKTEAAI